MAGKSVRYSSNSKAVNKPIASAVGLGSYISDELSRSLAYKIALVLASSFILAAFTQIKVFLPFTPIPITGQTFAVLIMGYVLGARLGLYSVVVYILLGLVGLPFFASGASGILYLKGVTGGYLVGFIPSVILVGYFSQKELFKNFLSSVCLFLLGLVPVYVCGLLWLGCLVGFSKVLGLGLIPFIPGAILKVLLASGSISLSQMAFRRS